MRKVMKCKYGDTLCHLNRFTNKCERCSYTCRKDRTMDPHYHEFAIKDEDDDKLIQEFLKKATKDQNTNTSFTKALEEIIANLIGSISISTSAACSDQFCIFLSQLADLSVKYYRANPNIIRDTKSIIKPFNKNSMKSSKKIY